MNDDRSTAGILLDIALGAVQMLAAVVAALFLVEWLTPWEVAAGTRDWWGTAISYGVLAWLWRTTRERNRLQRALNEVARKYVQGLAERAALRAVVSLKKERRHR